MVPLPDIVFVAVVERHQDARLVLARFRALGRYIRRLAAALDRYSNDPRRTVTPRAPPMADLVETFRNAVLSEAVTCRGHGIYLVNAFANGVTFRLDRYLDQIGVDPSTAQALRDMAARAIDRARAAGQVEVSEIEACISEE
jgi:hypothetical protein